MGTNISVRKVSLSRTLEKKLVEKLSRNQILCQTTLQLEFDNETNYFSCYESKRFSKAAPQLSKSFGTFCHDFFLRRVEGGSTQQSKGISLQFPPSPTFLSDTHL